MQALSGILSNLFVTVVVVGVISAALANVINNQVLHVAPLDVCPSMIPVNDSARAVLHAALDCGFWQNVRLLVYTCWTVTKHLHVRTGRAQESRARCLGGKHNPSSPDRNPNPAPDAYPDPNSNPDRRPSTDTDSGLHHNLRSR